MDSIDNTKFFFFLSVVVLPGGSPSVLKMYVATIGVHHSAVDGFMLGTLNLIITFLYRARHHKPTYSPTACHGISSPLLNSLKKTFKINLNWCLYDERDKCPAPTMTCHTPNARVSSSWASLNGVLFLQALQG